MVVSDNSYSCLQFFFKKRGSGLERNTKKGKIWRKKNSREFDFAAKAFDERDAMIVKMSAIKK